MEFPEAHLSWVWRDQVEQNLYFEQGKTKLKWPNSEHNRIKDGKPSSRAFDLFRLSSDGKAEFPTRFYFQVSEFLKRKEAPIIWGGSWKTFGDGDHYQLKSSIV